MVSDKITNNAYKLAYLIKSYPEKPFRSTYDENREIEEQGVMDMLGMPALDINTATWKAQELGLVGNVDLETGKLPLLKEPEEWNFGEGQTNFQEAIMYGFRKLAEKESDLEEYSLQAWLSGYPPHDIFIAVKYLLETNQLAEYEIEDGENKYLFYTLYENREQFWGRKQFKKDPMAQEDSTDE